MAETYFIRHAKQRDYTVMDNTFLKDEKLSWKAKGLFAYILSLPEDWKIYISELQTHATDGETSVRSAIKELTELGYIKQNRLKDEHGRWAAYAYEIIEKPHVENRDVVKPDMENHDLINTNNNKYLDIKIENVKGVEKEDLLLYFTISANIDICDNLIKKFQYSEFVLDKEKKWLEVIKYFTYTKIKLYTILGIIRDEYNSGVEEGGIKIGKRCRRVSKVAIG